jgi:hypothetical protein
MPAKLGSFVLVTTGLFLCTFEESRPVHAHNATVTKPLPLQPLFPSSDAPLLTNSTQPPLFYTQYPRFPPLRAHGHFGRGWRHKHKEQATQRTGGGGHAHTHRSLAGGNAGRAPAGGSPGRLQAKARHAHEKGGKGIKFHVDPFSDGSVI